MTDERKLIDLTVGEFKALLRKPKSIKIKPKAIINPAHSNEYNHVVYYFTHIYDEVEKFYTATELKHKIGKSRNIAITNIKSFGQALRFIFGKPIQKKNYGYRYKVHKLLTNYKPDI